ncbi:putative RNA uridine N3 methyltransferase [Candidatus Hecatella orcuttiae]|uniref:putative RNA uridine N3 methyltransferase n=1 Tax=Candidatus Hecatella orcuttiae TaxID=1935119 RepID=UPI0028680B79|nr:putative RNA uridine N3 methyltransferase [Candidatus Hecatella orcuttiae]
MESSAPRRKPPLTVAIPASVVADTPHLREKTSKLGLIGRALAIFRVDYVVIYQDEGGRREGELRFVERVLAYMATPQYLRRALFQLSPELRYAGILPPLRTPHHPVKKSVRDLRVGEVRQGLVVKRGKTLPQVDIGVEKPALLEGVLPSERLLNVQVTRLEGGDVYVKPVALEEIPSYWGFQVECVNRPLDEVVKRGNYGLTVATSKFGTPLERVAESLVEEWRRAGKVLVAFGSPTEGLREILARRRLRVEDLFDYTVNTVGKQGTETVRVEEALTASLAVFNFLLER